MKELFNIVFLQTPQLSKIWSNYLEKSLIRRQCSLAIGHRASANENTVCYAAVATSLSFGQMMMTLDTPNRNFSCRIFTLDFLDLSPENILSPASN